MYKLRSLILITGVLIIIIIIQFILGKKHLEFGFFIDDWDNLAAYKMYVQNPILDMLDAWKGLGSHRFAHVYYIGILFEFFKFDYLAYNITNQLLKALSAFSLFPLIYLLFKNKLVAFLTSLLYVIHFSTYGTLDDVSRGEDFLAIIAMNLFLIIFVWASQKHSFNPKVMFSLFFLFLSTAFLAPSRTYPVLLMLPLVELFNFWLNRSSTSLKSILKRLTFLYSPFIILLFISPDSIIAQIGYYKGLWEMLKNGNFQLLLAPFASFGSNFVANDLYVYFGPPYYQKMERFLSSTLLIMLTIFIPLYTLIGFLITSSPRRFIIKTSLNSIFFSILFFMAANRWLHLDLNHRASVDPGTFFIPALVGLFILSSAIVLFLVWLYEKKRNDFLLGLSLSPIISFLYIFITWVLTDVNSIFLGVHPYLNIPAIGTSLYLAILFYLIYQKLNSVKLFWIKRAVAPLVLIFCISLFYLISSQAIDQYFSYWLKNGFAASDQERMRKAFWKELGQNKYFSYQNPALFYLDGFLDYNNGMYYENGFVWRIPAYLVVETGKTLPACDLMMYKVDIKELKVKIVKGKKFITQTRCGSDLVYPIENFYAFKLIDRNVIPNKSEVLKKIGID